jgi:hypothetical protein
MACGCSKHTQVASAPPLPAAATNTISSPTNTVKVGTDSPAASDCPPSARAAAYSPATVPSFDSPEGVTRLLEQRWSLADIRAFCIPERRHNYAYQRLVADAPELWKGRLYANTQTGFDRISWYANVRDGHVQEYELEAYRGTDLWLLEIGDPETVRTPPQVTPDSSAPYFIGHK